MPRRFVRLLFVVIPFPFFCFLAYSAIAPFEITVLGWLSWLDKNQGNFMFTAPVIQPGVDKFRPVVNTDHPGQASESFQQLQATD